MDDALEQRCLDACRRGDALAYRPLVDAYFAQSVRLARSLIGELNAEDLAQDAFVAAYRAIRTHTPGRPFYPWLRGILANQAKVRIRSRSRTRARTDRVAQRPDHWTHGSIEGVDANERRLVQRALDTLDHDDRLLLVLKHVEGYTYAELSSHLGIAAGTVMSRLFRARQRLRLELERLEPRWAETSADDDTAQGEQR